MLALRLADLGNGHMETDGTLAVNLTYHVEEEKKTFAASLWWL